MISTAWKYYIGLYKESYSKLALIFFLSIIQSAIYLPMTWLIRHVFGQLSTQIDLMNFISTSLLIGLLNLIVSAMTLISRRTTIHTTKKAIRDLRKDILHKIYTFPRSYYSKIDRAKMLSSVILETDRLDQMSSALVVQFLPTIAIAIVLLFVLFYLNWILSLLLMALIPVTMMVSKIMKIKVIQSYKSFRSAFQAYNKGMLFALQTLDLVNIKAAKSLESKRQESLLETLREKGTSTTWYNLLYGEIQTVIISVSGIVILIFGGCIVARQMMSVGDLLSFYVIVMLTSRHLKTISLALPQLLTGTESLKAMSDIITLPEASPYFGSKKLDFEGRIQLKSVDFGYDDQVLLKDINLIIDRNSVTAITGPNGSGKSTLIYLILGLVKPTSGSLFADKVEYDDLDIAHLRRQIGVVMQDNLLFSGSIRDNIVFGETETSEQEMIEASILATAHDFIIDLPNGYDTQIGENGMLLSGGQRQRIAIARALIGNPKLLILDEPTHHLDQNSIRQLLHNLKSIKMTPGILLITHDIELSKEAGVVFAIDSHQLQIVRQPGDLKNISRESSE